jgi:hypothetical protein
MSDKEKALPRREFIRNSSAALGAAGVAVAMSGSAKAAGIDADEKSTGDYQETEHVKTYYELARF